MERTEISGNNLGFLMEDTKTTGQLMEFLKEGALFRSFGQVLRQVCPKEETLEGLAQGLAEITGEETESVARKVRNWRKGQNLPKKQKEIIRKGLELDYKNRIRTMNELYHGLYGVWLEEEKVSEKTGQGIKARLPRLCRRKMG